MHTIDGVEGNLERIAALFPNCVTEAVDEQGNLRHVVDFDKLKVELGEVVEGPEERYQFTWPGKRDAIRLANSPIAATLRPVREDSVDFDNTQNLYIEGDNLDVLKLLRETYLGKVKMIYIDPPYNTGNDFVYEDDFSQAAGDYLANSGQYDDQGNRLVTNTESNGRFHTDWLNMIYPRLKVARDLLTEDGVIFISIDDNEVENLRKICDEIFGEKNFLTCVSRGTGTPTGGGFDGLVNELDYIVIYSRNINKATINGLDMSESDSQIYDQEDEFGRFLIRPLRRTGGEDRREDRPTMYYPVIAPDGTIIYPKRPTGDDGRWRCSEAKYKELTSNHQIYWKESTQSGIKKWSVYQKFYLEGRLKAPGNLWTDIEGNKKATRDISSLFDSKKVFDFPKPIGVLQKCISIGSDTESIILDFFSGSATTAHAVLKHNFETRGNRKFIMIQIPESTDKISEAFKTGFTNICEIGKERIRRAGKKIKADAGLMGQDLDIGFRVLRLDSSNMEDVYYTPDQFDPNAIQGLMDNVKADRTEEDLLFQVMLELDIPLSASIQQEQIAGKRVFNVADGHLIATFDRDINETTVTEVARRKPNFFVMRDASAANDNVLDNFDQIFHHYSPDTTCKIL